MQEYHSSFHWCQNTASINEEETMTLSNGTTWSSQHETVLCCALQPYTEYFLSSNSTVLLSCCSRGKKNYYLLVKTDKMRLLDNPTPFQEVFNNSSWQYYSCFTQLCSRIPSQTSTHWLFITTGSSPKTCTLLLLVVVIIIIILLAWVLTTKE